MLKKRYDIDEMYHLPPWWWNYTNKPSDTFAMVEIWVLKPKCLKLSQSLGGLHPLRSSLALLITYLSHLTWTLPTIILLIYPEIFSGFTPRLLFGKENEMVCWSKEQVIYFTLSGFSHDLLCWVCLRALLFCRHALPSTSLTRETATIPKKTNSIG